jgi:DNA-binding ferritin-like protein (Dps family)
MIAFKTNSNKLLEGLKTTTKNINDASYRSKLFSGLKVEFEKFLSKFAAEFQAKYLDIAQYYMKNYGQNLQPETLKVLNAIMSDEIHNVFNIVLEGDKISVVIDNDLAFFIGALEYGTEEIVADKTLTNVREKMKQIANQKIALFIQELLNKNTNR